MSVGFFCRAAVAASLVFVSFVLFAGPSEAQPAGSVPPYPNCVWVNGGTFKLEPASIFDVGGVGTITGGAHGGWGFYGRGLDARGREQGWACPPQGATLAPSSPFSLSLSGGRSWTRFSSDYRSTGTQAPSDDTAHASGGDLCGGFNMYLPVGGGVFEYGGGVNVCQDFTGKTTLFDNVRHGTTGHVISTIDPGPRFEPYVGVHVAGPAQTQFYFRAGPNFAYNKLDISSNQVPGGGKLETASDTYWATGLGVQAGIGEKLCANCVFGLPLSGSIGGKFGWYPGSHSISVTSSVFGFTETATVDHVTQYSVIGTLSVPLVVPAAK